MPTRRGLLVLVSLPVLALVGVAFGVEEFVLLAVSAGAAAVVCLISLAWAAHRALRSLDVEVVRPAGELTVGMSAWATVSLVDRGRRPLGGLWLELTDGWTVSFPGLAGVAAGSAVPRSSPVPAPAAARGDRRASGERALCFVPPLGPGERFSAEITVPTQGRGLWSLAPRRVWCVDPLGLFAWRVAWSPPLHVVVCPAPGPGRPEWQWATGAGRSDVALEAHGLTRSARGGGDELAGLRAYVPGDRLNRLHWPALGRTGALVVRDFVEPEARRVEVPVDDRPLVVDSAVSGAAATALAVLHTGTVVDLVTGSGERLTVAPGPGARTVVLEALAVVAPATSGGAGRAGWGGR